MLISTPCNDTQVNILNSHYFAGGVILTESFGFRNQMLSLHKSHCLYALMSFLFKDWEQQVAPVKHVGVNVLRLDDAKSHHASVSPSVVCTSTARAMHHNIFSAHSQPLPRSVNVFLISSQIIL